MMPEQGRLLHLYARLLAAAPDLSLRDGNRAVELAQQVWSVRPRRITAAPLALALAEAGRCADAAKLARALAEEVPAAEKGGLEAVATQWDAGPPCRPQTSAVGP